MTSTSYDPAVRAYQEGLRQASIVTDCNSSEKNYVIKKGELVELLQEKNKLKMDLENAEAILNLVKHHVKRALRTGVCGETKHFKRQLIAAGMRFD
jgi:hypothetical protein